MRRFYVDAPLQAGNTLTLPPELYHHWVKVLRARTGEQAVFFNGQGGEYVVCLEHIDKNSATVRVGAFNNINRTPKTDVLIGQVISKGDRMDYMVQKSTELGVHSIQLLTSEFCEERLKYERDAKKIAHWQEVAKAACEQCGLNRVPVILPPQPLTEWVKTVQATEKRLLSPTNATVHLINDVPNMALLIGPEGGLSPAEEQAAIANGFKPWQIGERVLRTETAPVVALSLIHWAS